MSYYPGQDRGSRTFTSLILFVIGVGLTVALYYVKTSAQSAKKEVERLQRLVANEKAALSVLEAELAYLSGPERMGELARSELKFVPITTEQVITLAELEERFPLLVSMPQGEQP